MPFTPSHAVIALPFARSPLVPAAIAVGAMTPDLPLFLRGVGLSYGFTHGWSNIVWTTLVAFVLLPAAYVPRNAFKARLHHPMVLGVKLWAFAHLLANGTLADVLLFGSFLLWAVLSFRAARQRDRAERVEYAAGTAAGTVSTIVVGVVAFLGFAFWGHAWLIGVRPF